jgi:hypothetical protein
MSTNYHYQCEGGHETIVAPIAIEAPQSVECGECGKEAKLVAAENYPDTEADAPGINEVGVCETCGMRINELPLRLHKPGIEWLVELRGKVDGEEAICGLFHSKDKTTARAFYDNAHRILSCWYVEQVWKAEGKK